LANGTYFDRNGNRLLSSNGDTLGRAFSNPLGGSGNDYTTTLPGVGGTLSYTFHWRHLSDTGVLTQSQSVYHGSDYSCSGSGCDGRYLFTSDVSQQSPVYIVNGPATFDPVVLYQVVLPHDSANQNPPTYTFTYNVYGEIDKVVYPTGAYERFNYGLVEQNINTSFVYSEGSRGVTDRWVSAKGDGLDEAQNHWSYSGVWGARTETAPDSTSTTRLLYVDNGAAGWGYSDARAGMGYDERAYNASGQILRRKLTEWTTSGSNYPYNNPTQNAQYASRNPRVTKETEIVFDTGTSSALAKTTLHSYDLTHEFTVGPIETSVTEYDWVAVDQNTAATAASSSIPISSNALRTQETTNLILDPNVSQRDAYRARNLVSLVTSTRIKDGQGNIVAQSSINYDEGGQLASFSDYGSVLNWTDPGAGVVRGNPTTTSRWLNFNGSTFSTYPSGTYLTTHAKYDQCGNVRQVFDARDTTLTNPSQISYADSFSDGVPRNSYAYPTSTTSAVPDSTGQYASTSGFGSTSVYDFNTGHVVSTTDPNGQTVNYDYSDPLNRLKQVTQQSNGARVQYNYSDSPGDLYVQVLADEDSRSIETRQYFDKLGRPIRSFLYDGVGSTPWSVTDTYYDPMGRVAQVSNPYRVSAPSGAVPTTCSVCTTTAYDALGRVLTVTTPDNSQVSTSYAASTSGTLGITVTVTDQFCKVTDQSCIKHQRRSLTDALGRLVRVDEPDKATGNLGDVSSPVQPTKYTYDVLGSLKRVDQDTQHRYFLYDSLSRLIRARNPEQGVPTVNNLTDPYADPTYPNSQWSMAYSHDANGNLLTRTDPRGVVSTYGYDKLNRNTSIDYANESQTQPPTPGLPTPGVRRYYDAWREVQDNSGSPKYIVKARGRLWQTETLGSTGTLMTIDGYDATGHPLQQEQQFKTSSGWSASYKVSQTYDVGGHVLSQSYPSGHTVYYNYDIAGRIGDKNSNNLAFTGNLGDGVQRSYDSIAGANAYDAASRLQEEKYGTLTPLYHKQHYNIRGQLNDVRLSTVAFDADEWNWNRGAIRTAYAAADLACQTNQCRFNSGPDNNGNVIQSQHFVPSNDQMIFYVMTEDRYSYDSLNRLKSIAEYHGTTEALSSQDFLQLNDYDRFGNRTINPSSGGQGINVVQTTVDTNTNRIYAPNDPGHSLIDYDVAGNQIKDTMTVPGSGPRVYDAENRMISANNGASVYTYSGDGQRVRRTLSGSETWQVYGMGGELLAEYAANAATFVPHEEYGYRNGQLLITAANGDEARLTNFIYNFYFRFGVGFSSNDIQTRVNALAAAGNQGGPSQLFTEAQNQAQAIVSLSNIPSDTNYVTALYLTYCQRYPDSGGLGYWVSQIPYIGRTGVRNAFAASGGEFSARVNNLWGNSANDNERTDAFVQYMYNAILHRWASGSEDTAAISAFDNAGATGQANVVTTAGTWARGLFNSSEYTSSGRTQHDFVYDLYQAFLRYAPDQAGWDWWTGQVGANWQNKQSVMDAFINLGPYAQTAGTLYREVLWLTPDQLGTPRMIAERTGSLAGIKRHDYLPFGEELFAGQGGRTTAPQGYPTSPNSNDSIRQKFTLKERDNETGLDYFLARYYSSAQGRFTSPDEFKGGPDELYYFVDSASDNPTFYADLRKPQSLNKYQYAYNNPLRWIDPDGHDPEEPEPQNPVAVPVPVGPGGLPLPIPLSPTTPGPSDQQIIRGAESVLDTVTYYTGIDRLADWLRPKIWPTPAPAPTTTTTPQSQAQPVAPPLPITAEHTKGKRKSTEEKHTRTRSGDKQPPGYRPFRRPPKKPDPPPPPPEPPKVIPPEIGPDGNPVPPRDPPRPPR